MGDTVDGSSNAAQSAHSEPPSRKPNFFMRALGIAPHSVDGSAAEDTLNGFGLSKLKTLRVTDVAVPRADITAIALDASLDDIYEAFRASGFSRLPVYDEVLDNPVGFLHLKDVTLKYAFNKTPPTLALKDMLRPLLFAPPSMVIGTLLQKMQTDHIHMALVIDEYGGVDGLLTIEDLIEQVVGDITDEHDAEEDMPWIAHEDGSYTVRARASLEDFEQVLGVDFLEDQDDEDIDTVGGLVAMTTGRVPARGEVIQHTSGYEFQILDADPRRIKRIKVCRS